MMGIIFVAAQAAVEKVAGPDMWDDILDDAGLEGAYTSLGSYPDSDLSAILSSASELLSTPEPEVLTLVGREGFSALTERQPGLPQRFQDLPTFLLGLDSIIHAQVLKLNARASVPQVLVRRMTPDQIDVEYISERDLCALAQGLLEGAVAAFGQSAQVTHPQCRHSGDERCLFQIAMHPPDTSP